MEFPIQESRSGRNHKRRILSDITITNPFPGEVTDISPDGMGLASLNPFPVYRHTLFTLSSGVAKAKILGEIRWCKLAGMRPLPNGEMAPLYRAGICFVDDIGDFVERNGRRRKRSVPGGSQAENAAK